MTILESLLSRLTNAANEGTTVTHDELCDDVRNFVNSPVGADIHLSDELAEVARQFAGLYKGGDFDPTHRPQMDRYAAAHKAIKTVFDQQVQARAELDDELAEVAGEILAEDNAPAAENDHEDTDGDGDAKDADGDGGQDDKVVLEQPEPPAPAEPEPVTAAAPPVRPAPLPVRRPSAMGPHRAAKPKTETTAKRWYSIVAAADVPRVTAGTVLNTYDLANAAIRKIGTMPVKQRNVPIQQHPLAQIKMGHSHDLTTYGDDRDIELINKVADEKRLPGGSLVAAVKQATQEALVADISGGCCTQASQDVWCAPSETDYSLCEPLASREGMVDLPTIPVNRGGIKYPVWPQSPMDWHGTVYANTCDDPLAPDYFVENNKTCISGPCPTWDEQRLQVEQFCVEGDFLRERGYPELTQRYIDDSLIAHAHFMNGHYLAGIYGRSDALTPFNVSTDGIGSTSDSVMDQVGLLVAWFRERYKLAMAQTLEGIAPIWFRDYLKLDLARKNNRSFATVTNAEIDDLFAMFNARVQWVYDTEGIDPVATLPNGPAVDGRIMPGTWAPSVEMVFYPAGSWVLGQADVIQLDTVYDSTKLAQNKYLALWMEAGFLLINRCNRSFRIRLDGLCRNGGVGMPVEITCPQPTTPTPDPEPAPDPDPGAGGAGIDAGGEGARLAQTAATLAADAQAAAGQGAQAQVEVNADAQVGKTGKKTK